MRRSLVILAALLAICFPARAFAAAYFVFFGTHITGDGKGFSLSRFDSDTGTLSTPTFLLQLPAPAYFILHPDGKHLYTCDSGDTFNGQPGGGISALAIDPQTAKLTLLNQQPSGGADPSYISLDKAARHVLVANYKGGNIAVFALKPDGSLGDRTAFIQHTGKSIDPIRQNHAYAHSIRVDPSGKFALVADLGQDKLFVYRYDENAGTLTPNDPPFATVKPGSGARHVIFHPNGQFVYLNTEMGSTVTVFAWDGSSGALSEIQTVSSLPADFKGVSAAAEIVVHPNGKFLYVSNRGMDTLAVFAIDQEMGKLTNIQYIPTQGKTPRNFAIDPTGQWLLITNHGSNNAMVFHIDPATGELTPHGDPIAVPYPFCERFLPVVATALR